MIMTKKQMDNFKEASRPLMRFLGENFHPHVKVIVEAGSAEILESSAGFCTDDYIPD